MSADTQTQEVLEKVAGTNRILVDELKAAQRESRMERRENDALRAENARLNAECARLARQLMELTVRQQPGVESVRFLLPEQNT